MKLGIMQPYFFPYLGYFDLINKVDRWVVFDTPQYIRHGWINRNRILHPSSGWQYIIIPIKKHSRNTPINQIEISDNFDYKTKILDQLKHYKPYAPFYDFTFGLVEECLSIVEKYIYRFNTLITEKICTILKIEFPYSYFSEMNLQIDKIDKPGDWSFYISTLLNTDEYINPPGGEKLFDKDQFHNSGIKLTIQKYNNINYSSKSYEFIPDLSIIDVLMWNNLDTIYDHLNK